MRIKLKRDQAEHLLELITYLLTTFPYSTRGEKLLDVLVNKIRIKLRNKLDFRDPRNGYGITLNEEEALAFEEWMSQLSSSIPAHTYVYEQNIAKNITNDINAIYG